MKRSGRFSTSATVRTLDTNVVVRLFVRDDDDQVAIAERLIVEAPFLVLPSVLIEAVWVAKSRYGMPRAAIVTEIAKVLGHENAVVVSPQAARWALDRFEAGADFADMLHYALAEELDATSFATFDKRIKPHQIAGSAVTLERLI
jgi:predicted nucleic-acid-binding protein